MTLLNLDSEANKLSLRRTTFESIYNPKTNSFAEENETQ